MSELRTLDQILSLADNGQYQPVLLQENDDLIADIVSHSQAYGAKAGGKLQITISYSTDRFGQIDLQIEHKVTKPKTPKAKATAWTADGGGLTIANPNEVGRLAMRVEGNYWNAYFALPGTMDDALFLGGIAMAAVTGHPERKAAFMGLMQDGGSCSQRPDAASIRSWRSWRTRRQKRPRSTQKASSAASLPPTLSRLWRAWIGEGAPRPQNVEHLPLI